MDSQEPGQAWTWATSTCSKCATGLVVSQVLLKQSNANFELLICWSLLKLWTRRSLEQSTWCRVASLMHGHHGQRSWRASRAQTYLNYVLKPIEVVDSQEPGLLQSIGRAMIGITATYIWEYPHAPVWISWAYWSCGLATDLTEGLENVKVYTSWGQGLHVLV